MTLPPGCGCRYNLPATTALAPSHLFPPRHGNGVGWIRPGPLPFPKFYVPLHRDVIYHTMPFPFPPALPPSLSPPSPPPFITFPHTCFHGNSMGYGGDGSGTGITYFRWDIITSASDNFERLCWGPAARGFLCGSVLAVVSGACNGACMVCGVTDACCSPACMRACAESGGLCSRFLLEEEALQSWPPVAIHLRM